MGLACRCSGGLAGGGLGAHKLGSCVPASMMGIAGGVSVRGIPSGGGGRSSVGETSDSVWDMRCGTGASSPRGSSGGGLPADGPTSAAAVENLASSSGRWPNLKPEYAEDEPDREIQSSSDCSDLDF
ncbi:hypothetical protein CC78DRAFT_97645 [Lojkania enalia]|uniref:Uncharacterized protein n=1 Tax=Lojkania enalia TaxID=147567 RepID=A0A9P4JYI8_9PLEO|nr:hypothetical protein CC78DRAFT_97645 [Didymosphaeria enalia]